MYFIFAAHISQFVQDPCQVLYNRMEAVAAVLDSAGLERSSVSSINS